jgi:hypothetical protein
MSFKKINYDTVGPDVEQVVRNIVKKDRAEMFLLIPKELKTKLKVIVRRYDTTLINLVTKVMADCIGYDFQNDTYTIKTPAVKPSKELLGDYCLEDAEDYKQFLYK